MSEELKEVRDDLRKAIVDEGMQLYAEGAADTAEALRRAVEAVAIKLGDTDHGPGLRLALYVVTEAGQELKKVAAPNE